MQTDAVHHLVHDKRRTRHIARVFHKRYTEEEYQNVGQKDDNTAHAADDTVGDEVFERSVGHEFLHYSRQPCNAVFNPLHRVVADGKSSPEYKYHYGEEYGEAEPAVGGELVEHGRGTALLLVAGFICLGQGSGHEAIFLGCHD